MEMPYPLDVKFFQNYIRLGARKGSAVCQEIFSRDKESHSQATDRVPVHRLPAVESPARVAVQRSQTHNSPLRPGLGPNARGRPGIARHARES